MFLLLNDIYTVIPESEFNKLAGITNNGDFIWRNEEKRVIEFVKDYLRTRFDIDSIFKELKSHVTNTIYSVDDRIVYNEEIYICIQAQETAKLITNTEYFTKIDNRNPVIIQYVIDILIYNLSARLLSRDIPQYRQNRYDDAKDSLLKYANGKLLPNLPLRESGQTDETGKNIAYVSADVLTNNKSF